METALLFILAATLAVLGIAGLALPAVPGAPLLFVGLMRLGRAAWSNHENRFHVTTTALFAGAVAATDTC